MLWGESARTAQATDMLSVWRARCASTLEGHPVTECGHFIPEEQPGAVVDAILRFCGTNP